jgi:protein-L-isoaspartate(D-aspartate) O-methyltransferase
MKMTDSYRHKGLRKRMVETIFEMGIRNEQVLEVMRRIPRHFFLDSAFVEHAYENKPFPIEAEQTISQPYTVAYMTDLLQVVAGQKILEIGTGSGYQASVLSALGAEVHSIERHEVLHLQSAKQLAQMGYADIKLYLGDGYVGLASEAPYDRIIVTAGAPQIPDALRMQLKIGGMMVIPVGVKDQVMIRTTRVSTDKWHDERFQNFRFVPFLKGVSRV